MPKNDFPKILACFCTAAYVITRPSALVGSVAGLLEYVGADMLLRPEQFSGVGPSVELAKISTGANTIIGACSMITGAMLGVHALQTVDDDIQLKELARSAAKASWSMMRRLVPFIAVLPPALILAAQ